MEEDVDCQNEFSMKRFGGIVATQLLYKAYNLGNERDMYDEDDMIDPFLSNSGDGFDNVGSSTSSVSGESSRSAPSFIGARGDANSRYYVGDRNEMNSFCHETSSVSMGSVRNNIRVRVPAKRGSSFLNMEDEEVTADHESDSLESDSNSADFDLTLPKLHKARKNAIVIMKDITRKMHCVVKLPSATSNGKATKGKRYCKPRKCVNCGMMSRVKCLECDKVYCYPVKGNKNVDLSNTCFSKHVNCISNKRKKRKTRSAD